MPRMCSVLGCNSNYKKYSKNGGEYISVFSFPKCPELRRKWIEATHRDASFTPTNESVVCANHFHASQITRIDSVVRPDGLVLSCPRRIPKLDPNAVPTIFPNEPSYITGKLPENLDESRERRQEPLDREREVCELHFQEDQIETKSRFDIKEGKHLEVPLKNPRLVKGAIPCKVLVDCPYTPPENASPDLEMEQEIPEDISQFQNEKLTLDDIIKNFQEIDPWVIKKTKNYISFVYIKEDPLPNVQAIAFINSDLELCFYCDSLEVKSLMFTDRTSFKFPIVCTDVDALRLTLTKLASYVETRQKKRGRFVSEDFMVLPFTPFQLRKRKRKSIKC